MKNKKNLLFVIFAIIVFIVVNGFLFYLYPGNFSNIAYVTFLIVPLVVAIIIVFIKFSFLFTERISEQEGEKELLRERQKEIVENMVEGLVVHNKSERILAVNSIAEKFLGVSRADIIGKTRREITKKSSLLDALFERTDSVNELEHSIEDRYGKEYVFKIISVKLSKDRGEVLKIIRDISRERRLDRMKTEYITVMSHKFLTPLNGIKWAAPSLLDANIKDDDKKRFIENIIKNTDNLIKLTSTLLKISEMEEGSFGYNLEDTDLYKIIKGSISDKTDDIKKKNISVSFNKLTTKEVYINGDKDRLKVVVDNLLDNALKYTTDGGKIDISLDIENTNAKMIIKDNGIGISKKAQENIFSKFFRDDRAYTMHTEGSGLGLFIVKNIINRHGGKIDFESSDKGGTTFFFTIPLSRKNKN